MSDWLANISRLAEQGGTVIWALMLVSVLLWFLIFERYYFLWFLYPHQQQSVLQAWLARGEKTSWYAHKIREALVSENQARLSSRLSSIKMLIAICPLLGLLGTVTGMVSVFDTIAITGTSDAKAMASGIYQATLPTMAGLMLALSALYFSHNLQQKTAQLAATLADQLGASQPAEATP